LGKELILALEELGLVSHTVWIEQEELDISKYVDRRANLRSQIQ
jgi:hypothetical protein